MKRYGFLLVVLLAFVLALTLTSGCSTPKKATKEEVTKPAGPAGPSEEELARQKAEREARERALREQSLRDQEARQKAERDRAAAEAARMKELSRIYFAYDRAELSAEAREILKKIADYLKANPRRSVTVEGNCDDRGTNEYNLALGQRRAEAASAYLQALGVERSRVRTVSYGEERPVCSEATESCWAQNRNDSFVFAEK